MFVKVEVDTWMEIRGMVWSGAKDVVLEIEKQGREQEALDILQEIFIPDFWGSIPTDADVNNYIQFYLADHMNLYGDAEEEED